MLGIKTSNRGRNLLVCPALLSGRNQFANTKFTTPNGKILKSSCINARHAFVLVVDLSYFRAEEEEMLDIFWVLIRSIAVMNLCLRSRCDWQWQTTCMQREVREGHHT